VPALSTIKGVKGRNAPRYSKSKTRLAGKNKEQAMHVPRKTRAGVRTSIRTAFSLQLAYVAAFLRC
jgi:hypothetical protein